MIRLKEVAIINSCTPSSLLGDTVDYLPMQYVTETGDYKPTLSKKENLPSGLNNFSQGDLLLAKISPCFENGKSALITKLETGFGMGSSELMPIKPISIIPQFLKYLTSSPEFINAGIHDYKGATGHQRISPRFVAEYIFDESIDQEKAVMHLNIKSEAINKTIDSLKAKLHHLDEYKTALIHNAVTKGLDANGCRILDGTPAAEMKWKDSGVEWIGEVPEGWDVAKLKSLYNVTMGETILKEDLNEDQSGMPVYSATKEDVVFGYVSTAHKLLRFGDIVIAARGNSIGNPNVIKEMSTSTQTTIQLKNREGFNSYFVKFWLQGSHDEIFNFDNTAIPQFTVDDASNIHIAHPNCNEASFICDYLQSAELNISKAKEAINKKIALLNEYKKSLINEAVSGEVVVQERALEYA